MLSRQTGTFWGNPSPYSFLVLLEFDSEENFRRLNADKALVGPVLDDVANYANKGPTELVITEVCGGTI